MTICFAFLRVFPPISVRSPRGIMASLKGYFAVSFDCTPDASWDLLLNPPLGIQCQKDCFQCNLQSLKGFDSRGLLHFLDVSGDTPEQRTSVLVNSLLQFLATAVSENGRFKSSPLGVWICTYINQLTQTQSQDTVSLSPSNSPFPFEELIGCMTEDSLESPETSHAKLNLALAYEVGPQVDPADLCNQLLIRSLLVLVPSTYEQLSQSQLSLCLKTTVLLADTLARLMNHVHGAWSVESVVQCSKDVLRIKEAPAIVANMLEMMYTVRELLRSEALSQNILAVSLGFGSALLCFRYLVAAGAREEFAANTGTGGEDNA